METGYATVVDPLTIIPSFLAYGIHFALAATQLGLAAFLVASGMRGLIRPAREGRIVAGLRLGLGALLVLPLLLGAPSIVSLLAGCGALATLVLFERRIPLGARRPGRLVRRGAIAAAAAVTAFMSWEGEDNLALGVSLMTNTQEWRTQELEWQLRNDVKAPKVGDLAPDFELQDPSGEAVVRLSDFRGVRPVALVFGSYT